MGELFEPQGVMSQREACLSVFRDMQPGEWIQAEDLVYRVQALTQVQAEPLSVIGAAWAARNTLDTLREIGMDAVYGGYRRRTPDRQVDAVFGRVRRVRNAARRLVHVSRAALANPEVAGPDRQRVEKVLEIQQKQAELTARRAQRYAP